MSIRLIIELKFSSNFLLLLCEIKNVEILAICQNKNKKIKRGSHKEKNCRIQ